MEPPRSHLEFYLLVYAIYANNEKNISGKVRACRDFINNSHILGRQQDDILGS